MQVLTRAGLVLLLFGTIVGDLAQLASGGLRAVHQFYAAPQQPPPWLVASDGRVVMLALTLGIVAPLCCLRRCPPMLPVRALSPLTSSAVFLLGVPSAWSAYAGCAAWSWLGWVASGS